jgi:mono/diheme cytochrome c family protein
VSLKRKAKPTTTAVALLLATGCSSAPAPYQGSPTRGQMLAHFDLALELRAHAINGDLARFRMAAQELADLDPAHDLPAEIILQLGPMRWEAQAAAGARTVEAAAQGAAEVARTCGDCHAANGVPLGDRFVVGERPPTGDTEQHMAGLAWITRLLWDGLVGPSDVTWNAGARALAEAGALPDELLTELPERDVRFASDRLQRLAGEAAAAREPEHRVQALGEIWATCSDCHSRTR